MFKPKSIFSQLIACVPGVIVASSVFAQTAIPLNDLSAFTNKANNWSIAGDVTVDISKVNALEAKPGKGVLVCIHEKGKYGQEYELVSNFKHGDLDLELDFMLTKESNSGIYLQGNYEVQLFDSWGKKTAKYNDNGGIYERWNDAKPEGEKGYEGYAPRFNVAKAPGLWQNIKISYQAPRFDAAGKKIANAVFLKIVLNGVTIHENVEVSGPTRGSLTKEDVASGPLRIQGDHGSLAIKNIVINNFDKKPGTLSDLTYKTYYGTFAANEDFSKQKVAETGKKEAFSWEILKDNNNFAYIYNGKYTAATDGEYTFKLQAAGNAYLKIDGKDVIPAESRNAQRQGKVNLTAGVHNIEVFNSKTEGYMRPGLAVAVYGPGFREMSLSTASSVTTGGGVDPILVTAPTNTVMRSFMDFKKTPEAKSIRIVHAVSVGSPANLHYTYDLDKGALLQVWRGEFLDATPMWHSRGDGSSRPRGSVTLLNNEMFLGKINGQSAWQADTTGSGYIPKGYALDETDAPTFNYIAFGSPVSDRLSVVDNKYFEREVKLAKPVENLVARVAEGTNIEMVSPGLYSVNNKSYFIQIADKSIVPQIRNVNGGQELIVPVTNGAIKYALLF